MDKKTISLLVVVMVLLVVLAATAGNVMARPVLTSTAISASHAAVDTNKDAAANGGGSGSTLPSRIAAKKAKTLKVAKKISNDKCEGLEGEKLRRCRAKTLRNVKANALKVSTKRKALALSTAKFVKNRCSGLEGDELTKCKRRIAIATKKKVTNRIQEARKAIAEKCGELEEGNGKRRCLLKAKAIKARLSNVCGGLSGSDLAKCRKNKLHLIVECRDLENSEERKACLEKMLLPVDICDKAKDEETKELCVKKIEIKDRIRKLRCNNIKDDEKRGKCLKSLKFEELRRQCADIADDAPRRECIKKLIGVENCKELEDETEKEACLKNVERRKWLVKHTKKLKRITERIENAIGTRISKKTDLMDRAIEKLKEKGADVSDLEDIYSEYLIAIETLKDTVDSAKEAIKENSYEEANSEIKDAIETIKEAKNKYIEFRKEFSEIVRGLRTTGIVAEASTDAAENTGEDNTD